MEDPTLDDTLAVDENSLSGAKFAGFWVRVGAALIDTLVLVPIIAFGFYNSMSLKSMPLMILMSLLGAAYKPWLEWSKSATLGKMAVKIRVVDESMNNISGEQALIRYFPWIISTLITGAINVMLYMDPGFKKLTGFMEISEATQASPLNMLNTIYGLVFLVIIIVVAFDARKQGLHDKLAGTYVVYNE